MSSAPTPSSPLNAGAFITINTAENLRVVLEERGDAAGAAAVAAQYGLEDGL